MNFLSTLLKRPPLLDVRAPVEFAKGSLPGAVNFPLLNDEERAAVGTAYKNAGQEAAIELGHSFLRGEIRSQRLAGWIDFVKSHPDAQLYCFRGGLRSQSVRGALAAEGVSVPLIEGGYKYVRQLLLQAIEVSSAESNFCVVSGFTGSGKTELLRSVRTGVCDLEGLAHHKGSAFGTDVNRPQPAQADFENHLGLKLFELNQTPGHRIFVEDESRLIGYSVIPLALFQRMSVAPVYLVDRSRRERAVFLTQSYVRDNFGLQEGERHPIAIDQLRKQILSSLNLIQRRLGGAEHQNLTARVEEAIQQHTQSGKLECHYDWVERLLERYYDPLYSHHLEKIKGRLAFVGSWEEVANKIREEVESSRT